MSFLLIKTVVSCLQTHYLTFKVFTLGPFLLSHSGRLVLGVNHEVVDVAADDARSELRRLDNQRAGSDERINHQGSGVDSGL
jgi:hypothetical protein